MEGKHALKTVRRSSEGGEIVKKVECFREKSMYFDLEEFRVKRFAESQEETAFRSDCKRLKSHWESTSLKRKISSA